ncbi:hypothetical protein PMG11_06528 [Penicillium brasilianum]|uniref:Cysteine-rich transmembrane CYSTM domain-containing protein n=2 Tax=Penicillium brasilianum TaxID=104259 RepID=A0A0F7TM98_PENBI|nr:hypothetical protein PMG11_06528 [Penicillium brasilianum]
MDPPSTNPKGPPSFPDSHRPSSSLRSHRSKTANMSYQQHQYPPNAYQQPGYGPPPGEYGYPQQPGYGPPQGYPQGPPPQMQYSQAPPPQQQKSKDRGCLGACLATLCCCFVCEEGCECCADCIECCEMC